MLAHALSKKFSPEIRKMRALRTEQERDLDLVRRIAEQDESAMRELYAAYGQRMYAYALRLADVPAIAEDVVQDTLMVVWRSAKRFRNLLVNLAKERVVLLSTHIVEDIGQTCRVMAVLSRGEVVFRGSPTELLQAAEGHVWTLLTSGAEKLNHGLTVVSMLHLAEGVQYRLVGACAAGYPQAQLTRPGLEDGYVWLMKNAGQTVEVL